MSKIIIYCDGGCRGNGKETNIGGWGAILICGEYKKEIYGGEKNTTNNRMELKGCIEALKQIITFDIPVVVNADSAYVVNCFKEKWYLGWQKNGWKNSQKKAVENKDLWVELLQLVGKFNDIKFEKCKGHNGVELNEVADALVNKAMDELV